MNALWGLLLALAAASLLLLLIPMLITKSAPFRFYFAFVPLFMGATVGLYAVWGASGGLREEHALARLKARISEVTQDPAISRDNAMAQFASIEKEIGYSAYALTQMASIYDQLGLFDNAIGVLEKAMILSPTEREFQVQWIYTHSLMNQGKLPQDVRAKADQILQKQQVPELLNLLAIDDYFQGNYQQAVKGWELLLVYDQDLPADKKQVIETALQKAKSLIPAQEKLAQAPHLVVNVKLSAALLSQVLGNETVFVFVKQLAESMPLAVIKKKATDCPFTVDFDSKHSMIAGKPLTEGMEVEVVAKLSKTSDPLDKQGELRATSQQFVIKSENEPVMLEII